AEQGREVDLENTEEPLHFFSQNSDVASVIDHEEQPCAYQVLDVEDTIGYRMSRFATPVAVKVRRVRLAVALRRVPPMGLAGLDMHASPSKIGAKHVPTLGVRAADRTIESDLIKLEVRGDGTVDILDKRSQVHYLRAFALEDVGDVGDEYNYS